MRHRRDFEVATTAHDFGRLSKNKQDEIEEIEHIRPSRPKSYAVIVVAVVVTFFVLISTGCSLITYGLWSIQKPAEADVMLSIGIASGFAAIVCIPVAYWRIQVYDDQPAESSSYAKFRPPAERPPEPKIKPYLYQQMGQPERIVIGDFSFTAAEWMKLARALGRNDWKVTRSVISSTGLFTNVNDNYQSIVSKFSRAGWLPEDSEGNEKLTRDGIAYLSEFYRPAPVNNGASSSGTGPTTTTTTPTTGES